MCSFLKLYKLFRNNPQLFAILYSIIKRLIEGKDAKIPHKDERTVGVDIYEWDPNSAGGDPDGSLRTQIPVDADIESRIKGNVDVKFSVWDFAGQHVYHVSFLGSFSKLQHLFKNIPHLFAILPPMLSWVASRQTIFLGNPRAFFFQSVVVCACMGHGSEQLGYEEEALVHQRDRAGCI